MLTLEVSAQTSMLSINIYKWRDHTSWLLECPGYDLNSRFRHKEGLCVYARGDISCQRMETLEPRNFDVMWIQITSRKMTKFLCCMYRSPNDKSYTALFEH